MQTSTVTFGISTWPLRFHQVQTLEKSQTCHGPSVASCMCARRLNGPGQSSQKLVHSMPIYGCSLCLPRASPFAIFCAKYVGLCWSLFLKICWSRLDPFNYREGKLGPLCAKNCRIQPDPFAVWARLGLGWPSPWTPYFVLDSASVMDRNFPGLVDWKLPDLTSLPQPRCNWRWRFSVLVQACV